MKDFLKFRRMVTPIIIQVLFWIALGGVVATGLAIMAGAGGDYVDGGQAFGAGLMTLIFGPLVVRVYAELLIVVFRINDTLTDISDRLADEGGRGGEPA